MQPTQPVSLEEPLGKCPACGYEGGFHILLERVPLWWLTRRIRLCLKCPNCRTAFDPGLNVQTHPW